MSINCHELLSEISWTGNNALDLCVIWLPYAPTIWRLWLSISFLSQLSEGKATICSTFSCKSGPLHFCLSKWRFHLPPVFIVLICIELGHLDRTCNRSIQLGEVFSFVAVVVFELAFGAIGLLNLSGKRAARPVSPQAKLPLACRQVALVLLSLLSKVEKSLRL